MSDDSTRYDRLIRDIEIEFPRFRLIPKRAAASQKLIHWFLKVISLGAMSDYLDGYYTTIGQRVYVTDGWESETSDARYITLRHELVHMRQFRRFTPVGLTLLYLLFPLPFGLAYFRYRMEREAYAESIRASAEIYGISHVQTATYRARIIRQFTGAGYGWMWPFPRALDRWYDSVVGDLP